VTRCAPIVPRLAAAALVLSAALASASARADDPPTPTPTPTAQPSASSTTQRRAPAPEPARSEHRLVWRDEWPRFRTVEYGVAAALAIEYALIEFKAPQPKEANFTGPWLFDREVRNTLRLRTREARADISAVSDIFPLALQAHALFDAIVIPLVTDRWNFDVAWQMTMMNVMAMSAVGVFNRTGHRYFARERPDATECRSDPEYKENCDSGGKFASFPGGHASGAFLGAGMVCAHHAYLPLYGGGAPDVLACAVPVTASVATGVMRIMADRHYTTDVIVGSIGGFTGGFLLPTLLHYGYPTLMGKDRADEKATIDAEHPVYAVLVPSADPDSVGLRWVGVF
jgi:membrane-associated phospholipid phosphatase